MGTPTSLVPNLVPSTLMTDVFNAAGENGIDGSTYPPGQRTAGYGQDGSHGENATPPTEGGSGRDLDICLNFNPQRPGCIKVQNQERGDCFELSSLVQLLLDTHGGNGGNGGCGEDGQHGGPGYDGADATRSAPGQNGTRGGSGGNGGKGGSGADGGRGGNIFTRVEDNELDLLLAVDYKTEGGRGGAAGRHGAPGKGGLGGKGGKKYRSFSSDNPSRPGGSPGPNGSDGLNPSTILCPGLPGEDGSICINVVSEDGTVRSYPSRYHIIVESFEVVDENNDGINEPGEYLFVKNIIVRNEGPMPSPSDQLLKVVIRSSAWLDPDTTAPLNLPDSIMPNRQVRIPGQLRALIRHESTLLKPGKALNERETVSLLGYSERLVRSIPEFSGGVPIIVQYPLQLAQPIYMDCMEKGDEMTISWMVNNVSTAVYGHSRGRTTTAKLIDTGRNFVFRDAEGGVNYIQDDVDKLKPATGSAFGETIMVSDETRTFSTGSFTLELHLSDPHSGNMRRIMHHKMNIQISEGYRFNSTSQFLLIVNASTDNKATIQIQKFIRTQLFLDVDTLNLSLTGNTGDQESDRTALFKYRGKSIIISGNSFTYFSKSTRYNWDLIDPQDARLLLMSQTSFLFCEIRSKTAQESLKEWTSLMIYPSDLSVESADSLIQHKSRNYLLKDIQTRSSPENLPLDLKYQYMVSTRFGIVEEIFGSNGSTLSRKLVKQVPMRRFMVASEDPSVGIISVMEGLPRSSSCISSQTSIIDADGVLTRHQGVMMIASIPFHILAVVFWNIVRSISSSGITTDAMYRNLPGCHIHREINMNHGYGGEGLEDIGRGLISYEVCRAVAWAVEHALDSDIQQLCNTDPLVLDKVNKKTILSHTPRLRIFLNGIPKDSITVPKQGIEIAVQLFGSLSASLSASDVISDVLSRIPGFRTRRVKLRRYVSKFYCEALEFMGHKSMRQDIKKSIREEKNKLTKEQRMSTGARRTSQNSIRRKLKALTGDSSMGFVDIAAAEQGSVYMSSIVFDKRKTAYRQLLNQQRNDMSDARETRGEIIMPVFETLDYLPVTSFR